MKHIFITAILVGHAVLAAAQGSLEVIPLRHRSAEQVIPILRPLMEAGGVLSGQGYQLIVRTSPGNLADIRSALAAIDAAQRRLVVSVRFEGSEAVAGGGIEAQGALRAGGLTLDSRHFANERSQSKARSEVEVRIASNRASASERVDQRVQVLEGGRAYIATGQSRPLTQRQVFSGPGGTRVQDTTVMQTAETGFAVVPRISGETVFLEIEPQRETFERGGPGAPDTLRSQHASSRVSGRLGEWIELGSALASAARSDTGVLSSREAGSSSARCVWVKVEALQP